MRTITALLLALACCGNVRAQDKDLVAALQKLDARVFKAESPEAKLRWDSIRQLREDVNRRDVEAWRKIQTKADWEAFRDARIAKLRESLGSFPPTPKQTKVTTTKKLQGDGFTIECILYETRPNFFVSANLYVPADTSKPMPGFIIIHSHHNPKTQGELQDMGMNWARQGCLVLVPDMIDHGERRQHPFVDAKSYPGEFKVGRQDYFFRYNVNLQLSLVGESLMGWMVWDLMRGVDVLYQRPNLDKSKVMAFGSVAGGGDPCAVFAALDQRVTAAAPFNFGGPQPETKFPLPEDAELAFNYVGGGSWESTRNLKLSARDGFLPWVIVGSIAPRGLIYAHEFAWDDKRDPVWARFHKIWGDFYGARDKLASAKGRGSVKGMAPESTHCNNIGAEHRKPIYPTLNKWFGLPVLDNEYKKRFDSSELQCWTEEARRTLKPKLVHEILREFKPPPSDQGKRFFNALGNPDLANLTARVETLGATKLLGGHEMAYEIYRHEKTPTLALPMVMIKPAGAKGNTPVVIALAQDGKSGFFKHRMETIALLLQRGVAVCLPDLRGTGETANDGRGRTSGATSYSASLLMHGQTPAGVQLQELAMLLDALSNRGFGNIALWGDSFAEPNDAKTNLAVPHDVSKMPRQSEPMGALLALRGGVLGFGNKQEVKAIYVRGGVVSYRSMLESPFCWYPHDAVVPGALAAGDLDVLVEAHAKKALRMEGLVDGMNRRVDQSALEAIYANAAAARPRLNPLVLRAEPSAPAEVAVWLADRLKN